MKKNNLKLGEYLKGVFDAFQKDNDTTRALRRLHIKEVHMARTGKYPCAKMIKEAKRLLD